MNLINFAIDFGNGYIKAKSDKAEFVFSSKIGNAYDLGTSSLDTVLTDERGGYEYHTYQRKDEPEYVAGKDIEKIIDPDKLVTTNSNNNRYKLASFKRLIDFALTELASYEDEKNIEIRLVSGLPSNEMKMDERKKAFEEYLLGNHLVKRDGVDYVINVKELKLIEQPLGTLLNVYLNDDLKVHKTFKNGLVVVVDFGSGTTIIDVYKNMRRIGGDTMTSGMIEFQQTIADRLSSKHSVSVNRQHIEDGIRDNSFTAKLGVQTFDFKGIFREIVHHKLESVVQAYENVIAHEELVNDFILTGGGSLILGEELKKAKDNFRLIDNPQTSTANGYLKLAKSLRKDE